MSGTKEIIVEAVQNLGRAALVTAAAKQAYPDALQPAASELGQALGTIASAANLALRPIKTAVAFANQTWDSVDRALGIKLKDVAPEKIIPPPANVAASAMLQLALIAGDDRLNDIRNMFIELIASGMNSDRSQLAHPAFVEALKQCTPVEARIIDSVSRNIRATYPVIEVRIIRPARGYVAAMMIPHEIVCPDGATAYAFGNLVRLGFFELDWFSVIHGGGAAYAVLESDSDIVDLRKTLRDGNSVDCHRGVIKLTELGHMFVCATTGARFGGSFDPRG